jgi:hypothetical protein
MAVGRDNQVMLAEEETLHTPQTAPQHYLPPWGMKPTVLYQRNPSDLHALALMH